MAQAQELQVALGKVRRISGHYAGKLLLIDPHRPPSYSQRHMRKHQKERGSRPIKTAQTFFCLDGDSAQPLCFTSANSARTVSQATPELLRHGRRNPRPAAPGALVAADTEHFTVELVDHLRTQTPFDLITPMPNRQSHPKALRQIPAGEFTPHWAGYATAVLPYTPHHSRGGPYYEFVQRHGERPEDWQFNGFFSTTDRDPVDALTRDYPQRWHIEEFFNFDQSLGWKRAGTMNINIRYGQMTMALLAQTVIHQFRKRLGAPLRTLGMPNTWRRRSSAEWTATSAWGKHHRCHLLQRSEPTLLRAQYEDLPAKLRAEGVEPRIPWLYGFQLDFRFR